MLRGKIDLTYYGLIREYKPPFGRWLLMASAIPALAAGGYIFVFYIRLHQAINPDYQPIIEPYIFPYFLLGALVIIGVISLNINLGRVLLFQEGIYVHPGLAGFRDPARQPAFLPWDELRGIIRTPYKNGGMSLLGKGPLDEVILPARLFKRLDEIQDDIRHMGPNLKIRVIDLRDASNQPLGEYGSLIQGWWGFAPVVPVIVGLFKVFMNDSTIAYTYLTGKTYSDGPVFLLPIITGGVILGIIGLMLASYRSGHFTYRFAVYKDGLLTLQSGVVSFARWEEIQSIEKIKPGLFRLNPIDEKMRAAVLNIGKSQSDDFERVMKRLGRLVG